MKRTVTVSVPYKLSKEERRSFHKDHSGYRLCFRQRYPKNQKIKSNKEETS